MTQASPPLAPFADDPALGRYRANYPIDRLRLMIQAGIVYGAVVVFLQVFFIELDDNAAATVLPFMYAIAASGALWYLTHLWNREVVLYERGFTYREGSRVAQFYYHEVVRVHLKAERLRVFGVIRWDRFAYTFISSEDETLRVDGRYKDIMRLGPLLEQAISQARLPLVSELLLRGSVVEFGPYITLSNQALTVNGNVCAWGDFVGYRTEGPFLVFSTRAQDAWERAKLGEIDNAVLLVELLRGRI